MTSKFSSSFLCLFVSFSLIYTSSLAITPQAQVQSLFLLYNSTHGENWSWKNEAFFGPRWSFTSPQTDPCNAANSRAWQGITCSSSPVLCQFQQCLIVSISLTGSGLNGNLPNEMFSSLTSLTTFQITSSENLSGRIPDSMKLLTQLQGLILSDNAFSGPIPKSLCELQNLKSLILSSNQLNGTIPSEIGFLSQLAAIGMSRNLLTGSLPMSIGSLLYLSQLFIEYNQIKGTIPLEIGGLTSLTGLSLYSNQFTGTIPSEFGQLIHLSVLYLYQNKLRGLIPSELRFLSELTVLSLYSNQFTGPIPTELFHLTQLLQMQLSENSFSGSISPAIQLMSSLTTLSLFTNQLNGSLPFEIGHLTNLQYIDLADNFLTGSIASEFGSLQKLQFIDFSGNYFSESIPSEIGSLTDLQELDLSTNLFIGSIPSSLTKLTKLTQLHLHENHLSGPITFSLLSFISLQQFFLQQNQLTGNLHQLLSLPVNEYTSPNISSNRLVNFDMSDNLLSGSIPSSLFLLPQLQTISLSLNCFEDKLPSSMCQGKGVQVYSMDGLGSAERCQNIVTLHLFTTVTFGQRMDGSIPECMWFLPNLMVLNLAGNGFKGKIGSVSEMASLESMTLSHNYLSGEIPSWLQEKNLSLLDLSHNKLTGDVSGFKGLGEPNTSISRTVDERTLKLTVNRLSGDLSYSFDFYSTLDILSGNLFSCERVPGNDKNSEWSSCGSEEYDRSMSAMAGVVALMFMVITFYALCMICTSFRTDSKTDITTLTPPEQSNFHTWFMRRSLNYRQFLIFIRYYRTAGEENPLTSAISFGFLLSNLVKSICILSCLSIVLSLPLYVLKELSLHTNGNDGTTQYTTHSHMYRWLWTMAFLSGSVPAIILLVVTLVSLMFFSFILNQISEKTQPQSFLSSQSVEISGSIQAKSDNRLIVIVWVVFLLNTAVVGAMNGLYLWSTLVDLASDVRILIQVGFGFFSFFWNVAILQGAIPLKIKDSRYGVWLFSCLSLMNHVIIPCIVTALSSPSCYQV
jgi:Leucine-rich repeat (LRR) protein